MKAITLYNPHAMLMAIGAKMIETRPRKWSYVGPVAIHAGLHRGWCHLAKTEPFKSALSEAGLMFMNEMAEGAVVAIGNMVGCVESEYFTHAKEGSDLVSYGGGSLKLPHPFSDRERAFGNYEPGRFCYVFDQIRRLSEPVPAKGNRGMWDWIPPAGLTIEPFTWNGPQFIRYEGLKAA